MVLGIHIISALSSLALTGFNYFRLSKVLLRIDYVLVTMTLLTAFYLILTNPADLISACISGITYLAFVLAGIFVTLRKLARINETI